MKWLEGKYFERKFVSFSPGQSWSRWETEKIGGGSEKCGNIQAIVIKKEI